MDSKMNTSARKKIIAECDNIVIKVGTRLLTEPECIPKLISSIAELRRCGYRIILVSSGAVGIGMKQLGLTKRPSKLSQVQALAAIGQNKLMSIYDDECRKHNFKSAQLLLTAQDMKERHLNILNCIHALWSNDVLPIVNENDSVSVDELTFGDNDFLAAMLGTITRSPLTVILTTESGLRARNSDGTLGERISTVTAIDATMKASASGTDDSHFSIGGMISKLTAAEMVNAAGEYLWVADGRNDNTLLDIIAGKDIGTLFVPNKKRMSGKKRWLSFLTESVGQIIIDAGAVNAVGTKGSSLLPSGVIGVNGNFERGATVDVCDNKNNILARGLTNFSAKEIEQLKGCQTVEIATILKHDCDNEIIHRDNLVVIEL
jgi:glutamate 5-kinase